MKRFLLPLVALFTMVSLCACLGTDDEEIEYNEDTAITAFSLGTLNRYLHTLSKSNTDSVYKTTITGSNYKFYIDQVKCEIYNPDSLPYGTDAQHVICTINSKNNGVVLVKSMTSDSLSYYNSSDSLDFTSPRTVFVYSNSGRERREYTIRLNVHQEEADSFKWKAMNIQTEMAALQTMKGFCAGGNLLVFGNDGVNTVVYSSSQQDGNTWTKSSQVFSADAYRNVVKKDGMLFMKDGNKLLSSGNGSQWTELRDINVRQLVAASTVALYAIDNSGRLVSSFDEGMVWRMPQTFLNDAPSSREDIVAIAGEAPAAKLPATYVCVWGSLNSIAPSLSLHSSE